MSLERVADLIALDLRIGELNDGDEYEAAVQLCEGVLRDPNLPVLWRDYFTYSYCLCLHPVCKLTNKRIEEFLRVSSWLLHRYEQSDCHMNIESDKCQIHGCRADLLFNLKRYGECISEATMAIQINPMNEFSIWARRKRCAAYAMVDGHSEMKSDLDELRRMRNLGLAIGLERQIEALSAMYDTETALGGGGNFSELFAEGLASNQSVSTVYDPSASIDWNVNALLLQLKGGLENVSADLCKTGDVNKHLNPIVCFARKHADALVHLVFAAEERRVFPRLMPREPSRVAVLRVSDTMKNPLVLTLEQRERIIQREEFPFPILDQTEDFWPPEGFIIAYHLILECELCSPSLFRWIISEGNVIHSDRQQIDFSSELLFDIDFLPSLVDGRPLGSDFRWDQQVRVCRRLYNLLLGGLEPFFSSVERLIFVPDIHLFRVSFGSLLRPNGEYLIENHTVSISSSIRLIRENQGQKMRLLQEDLPLQIGALVCGEALAPGRINPTGTEIDQIVCCLQDDCEVEDKIFVLSRSLFDPRRLFKACRVLHPKVMHVVAHGSATDAAVDQSSSEMLEQFRIHGEMESSNRTLISARDVAWKCDLSSTDLVFLNSCSVGYGKLQKSGVLGFNNAIFQAGCPSVISSLWQAEVTLSIELTKLFYRFFLIHRFDKAEALRYSILALLRRHPVVKVAGGSVRLRSSPALWASYQLFGNPM